MKMNQKGKEMDEFMTPYHLFNDLHYKFNFTADAAATGRTTRISNFFEDGLIVSWREQRIFCNPPFSNKGAWIKKAHDECLHGGCPVCVMILPLNSMDTKPWHDYILGKFNYDILEGRVRFINPETGVPQHGNNSGTVVVYFWKKPQRKHSNSRLTIKGKI